MKDGLWAASYWVPAAIIMSIALFSGGTKEWTGIILVMAAIAAAIAVAGMIDRSTKTVRAENITIRQYGFALAGRFFICVETGIPLVARFRQHMFLALKPLVMRTGVSYDIEGTITTTTRVMILAVPLSFATAIILGILAGPIFFAVVIAPLIVYAIPSIILRLRVMERKAHYEEESAYFLCYVNIMQTVGHDLYYAFEDLGKAGIFPSMEKDSKEISKRVRMLGITKAESLSRYAASHPHDKFRDFVDGYLAKITSVGGVPQYTEAKARFFFAEYEGAWRRYEKSAQEIFSGIMMIAIILPMMIMLSAMIGTGESLGNLMMIGIVISPFISMIMITMLGSLQPATGNSVQLPAAGIILGAAVGIVTYAVGIGTGTSIAMAFLAMAATNSVITRTQVRRASAIDRMLPEFMRDVTEMSKTGSNINHIITEQARRRAYRGYFQDIIEKLASDLRMGLSFREAAAHIRTPSMNFRFVMFLLERTHVTGGGTTGIFSMITEFVGGVYQAKEQVRRSLTSLSVIVYISPFLIIGIAHAMIGMMSGGLSGVDAPGVMFAGGADIGRDDAFISGLEVMAAAVSIPMGLVAAKISSFTVRNTIPLGITSLMTILAIEWTAQAIDMLGIFPR